MCPLVAIGAGIATFGTSIHCPKSTVWPRVAFVTVAETIGTITMAALVGRGAISPADLLVTDGPDEEGVTVTMLIFAFSMVATLLPRLTTTAPPLHGLLASGATESGIADAAPVPTLALCVAFAGVFADIWFRLIALGA